MNEKHFSLSRSSASTAVDDRAELQLSFAQFVHCAYIRATATTLLLLLFSPFQLSLITLGPDAANKKKAIGVCTVRNKSITEHVWPFRTIVNLFN